MKIIQFDFFCLKGKSVKFGPVTVCIWACHRVYLGLLPCVFGPIIVCIIHCSYKFSTHPIDPGQSENVTLLPYIIKQKK